MSNIIYFYISSYFIGLLLCIPIGPVNLEIFHTSLKKHYAQAVSIAIGAAIGDAIWAITAFYGISPFRDTSYNLEWIFFLITAVITGSLGIFALKDAKFIEKRGQEITTKIKRKKRWAFLKGLMLVLVNPLGIISWMISLKFLESFNIKIPLKLNYEIFFFLVVTIGAATYFLLIVFITNKMQNIFNPKRTAKITKYLGYVLITFSLYFFYYSMSAYFFGVEFP
ncbi:MAG: LysE family transporter [Acidobacteriota bacterium]